MSEDQNSKYRRERAPSGMTLARAQEIEELLRSGREGEVSAAEMAEYEDTKAHIAEMLRPIQKQWEDTQKLIAKRLATVVEPSESVKNLAQTLRNINDATPRVKASPDDFLSLRATAPTAHMLPQDIDGLSESVEAAAEEREARERRAQETTDYSAQLLEDLINILQEVEVSNRATADTLHELRAARKESERNNSRQFCINVGLTILVAVASILVPLWLAS